MYFQLPYLLVKQSKQFYLMLQFLISTISIIAYLFSFYINPTWKPTNERAARNVLLCYPIPYLSSKLPNQKPFFFIVLESCDITTLSTAWRSRAQHGEIYGRIQVKQIPLLICFRSISGWFNLALSLLIIKCVSLKYEAWFDQTHLTYRCSVRTFTIAFGNVQMTRVVRINNDKLNVQFVVFPRRKQGMCKYYSGKPGNFSGQTLSLN